MKLIGRRNFIQGFGLGIGAGLLSPFARSLVAEAQGLQEPRRWILVHDQLGWGHGEKIPLVERWLPRNADLTVEGALPAMFEPLKPWASKMLLLDYLSNPFNPGQHGVGWAGLSVQGTKNSRAPVQQSTDVYPTPKGISVDVFAGDKLSAGRPFRMIGASTDSSGASVDASNNPVPYFRNALQMFTQVFGKVVTGNPDEIQARLKRRLSVLDLAKGDLNRMRTGLAGAEKLKLDQLESSIRALEGQLGTIASGPACTLPGKPVSDFDAGPHNGALPAGYLPAVVSIQTTALICRLTSVVVLRPTPGRRTYQKIFGHNQDKHVTAHADNTAALIKIDQYNASLLATMLNALAQVREGSGTMADRTLATWLDDGGGRHHAPGMTHENYPMLIVGNMGGALKTGRHIRWPKGQRALSDAFVTCLQALGISADTFGDPTVCKGPLPGLT